MNTAEKPRPWRPSKPVVIGLVGVVTIALFIWFAFFLKGKNVFSAEYSYHAFYKQTHGISVSSPVLLNGLKIGRVSRVDFADEDDHRIRVDFLILKKYRLPENSIASLESTGLLGGAGIVIREGNSTEFKEPGAEFKGHEVLSFMEQIEPLKDQLSDIVKSVDSILEGVRTVLNPGTIRSLNESFTALEASMKNVAALSGDAKTLLRNKKDDLSAMVTDLRNLSRTLNQNSGRIDHAIQNVAKLSDTLMQAQLGPSIQNLAQTINTLETLLKSIENGQGSAGKLIKNDSLYRNIEGASNELQLLLEDLRLHPSRYVHISLFGKKEKAYKATPKTPSKP